MRTLAPRYPNGSQNGLALAPDGISVSTTQLFKWPPTSQAKRPNHAGMQQPATRRASGFPTLSILNKQQSTLRMTTESPELQIEFEYLESPRHTIEAPVVFPREPETKKEPCPIRPTMRGDQNPEEDPEIATATAIVTATATAIATAAATVAEVEVEVQARARNPEVVALAAAEAARGQSPSP